MSSSADPRIQILIFDLEIDIQPKEHFGLHASQDVLRHLPILLPLVLVLLRTLANLHSGWVEGSVLILPRADQGYVLEPVQSLSLRQLVHASVFDVRGIRHAQLSQGLRLSPLLQEPETSVEHRIVVVHVAHMRRWQGDVSVKLFFIFFKVWKSSSNYNASERMTYKWDPS